MNMLIPKTDEEIILERMKKEERSTYWVARKIEMSQGAVYRILIGPAKYKQKITDGFKNSIKEIWPDLLFNHELPLSHEKLESDRQSLKDKPLWKDDTNT
jgi:hypothetical protein